MQTYVYGSLLVAVGLIGTYIGTYCIKVPMYMRICTYLYMYISAYVPTYSHVHSRVFLLSLTSLSIPPSPFLPSLSPSLPPLPPYLNSPPFLSSFPSFPPSLPPSLPSFLPSLHLLPPPSSLSGIHLSQMQAAILYRL